MSRTCSAHASHSLRQSYCDVRGAKRTSAPDSSRTVLGLSPVCQRARQQAHQRLAAGEPLAGLGASVSYRGTACLWAAASSAPPEDAALGCTISWKVFPALNVGTALAGIWTMSPVRGLRP